MNSKEGASMNSKEGAEAKAAAWQAARVILIEAQRDYGAQSPQAIAAGMTLLKLVVR